jgi:hypothetical protein
MRKRSVIEAKRLEAMEAEFGALLIPCLEECASGRWGLFDDRYRYVPWPEAQRLTQLALDIQECKGQFGASNATCERLLHYCSLRGPNVPGEPKLAASLLGELRSR